MKNAQKPEKVALGSLLNQLKEGRFVIPDFQRDFEWKPWDIQYLLKSILLDYYIGSLLLWKGKDENFDNLSCQPIYGHSGDNKREYIVLDGQQRLTAIYYAFLGPDSNFPNRKKPCRFYVRLDKYQEENYDESVTYEFMVRKWRKINDTPEELFQKHLFPFTLFGEGTREIIKWLDGYADYWSERENAEKEAGNEELASEYNRYIAYKDVFDKELEELDRDYQISYIELDKEIAVEKVCDIFTQINSKGVRLDIFDLLNAMLRPKDIQLKAMWREVSGKLDFLGTPKMNVYILQVMSILLQAYCSSKYLYYLIPGQTKTIKTGQGSREDIVLIKDKDEFNYHWGQATEALELAMMTLRSPRDYGVIKSSFIPYPSIVPVFSAVRRYARQNGLINRIDVKKKIRKWYWSSIFTNRYSSSVESTSAADFIAMKKWFNNDEELPIAVREFEDGFRNLDLRNENKKGTAIYNAILNLLIIRGANDFGNFDFPEYSMIDAHHIVPASWGRKHAGPEAHSILNITPMSAETNRNLLRDRLPNEYLAELFDNNKHTHKEVREILDSHYISEHATEILMRSNFSVEDYHEFLEERQKSLIAGIQDLLVMDNFDADMPIDELDQAIKKIELGLREIITEKIGDDPTNLPSNLLGPAKERLSAMLKKDVTKQAKDYNNTAAVMQFFDLRHLEQTITNKSKSDLFQEMFGQKEMLAKRFNQMAEMRNAIAHNRAYDDVIRKDAEAAILWFNKILKIQ